MVFNWPFNNSQNQLEIEIALNFSQPILSNLTSVQASGSTRVTQFTSQNLITSVYRTELGLLDNISRVLIPSIITNVDTQDVNLLLISESFTSSLILQAFYEISITNSQSINSSSTTQQGVNPGWLAALIIVCVATVGIILFMCIKFKTYRRITHKNY